MPYIQIHTLAYPVDLYQIRQEHPNTSIPEQPSAADLASLGYAAVQGGAPTTFDPLFMLAVEQAPMKQIDGTWVKVFTVQQLPLETVVNNLTSAIQQRLDAFARERGYDSILSACTYATSGTDRFRLDGQTAVAARDDTWVAAHTYMQAVLSGAAPTPTSFEEVVKHLPVLTWG